MKKQSSSSSLGIANPEPKYHAFSSVTQNKKTASSAGGENIASRSYNDQSSDSRRGSSKNSSDSTPVELSSDATPHDQEELAHKGSALELAKELGQEDIY